MRILLINVPHTAIGSRIPDDHLPPYGLLCVAGPLIDDGHDVCLIDGDIKPETPDALVAAIVRHLPDVVMFGHTGSTSAHPTIAKVASEIAVASPDIAIVYGGVYPTYHWRDVLAEEPYVTAIVRGEGEETTRQLIAALEACQPLDAVSGIAFTKNGRPVATRPAAMIKDLDAYRVGWELIDHNDYSYWGGKKAVIAQFSRGCPHLCTYCGQRGFWSRWRYRDPVKFAKELARLHREEGVELVNLADENPTSSRRAWRQFLEALIAEDTNLLIIGTTRAGDIVRDADILHLYRKAGCIRFLLGTESTDEATLQRIKKGSTTATDYQAIRLLRANGILSLASWVVGFEHERDGDYLRGLRQLIAYDPDQIIMLYITPHRWTPFFAETQSRMVIQKDRRRWDYKHQVLANTYLAPWRILLWVKATEVIVQARPKALYRTFFHPDPVLRQSMRWYAKMGRRVWFHEIFDFVRTRLTKGGPSLAEFWGAPQDDEEYSMVPDRKGRVASPAVTIADSQVEAASEGTLRTE
ncbi:MAG: magnesium-protoporphyrin IX monomethyl ester anaerobic oxidative cyclase [Hyphomicrobiaceae bacterium]